MTLGELMNVISYQRIGRITALAYFEKSKRYYSFRTVYDDIDYDEISDLKKELKDVLDRKVLRIDVGLSKLFIDIVEYVPENTDNEGS